MPTPCELEDGRSGLLRIDSDASLFNLRCARLLQ